MSKSSVEYERRPEVKARRKVLKAAHYRTPRGRLLALTKDAASRSRRMKIEYDMNALNHFADNPPLACECCGKVFDYSRADRKSRWDSPSLDRVDNTKGYVCGNIGIVCTRCNVLKKNATLQQLQQLLRYVERYL